MRINTIAMRGGAVDSGFGIFIFKSSFENECVSKEEGTFLTLRANAYADDIHPSLTYLTASNQALRYRCSIRVRVVLRLGEEVRLSRG